jgi:hypothetical protein
MLRNKQFYAPTQEVEKVVFCFSMDARAMTNPLQTSAETVTAWGIEKILKFQQFGQR